MNKLKPALCTISWRHTAFLTDIIELGGQLGIKGIEIWLPHLTTVSPSKMRTLLFLNKMEVVCISLPWGGRFWEHEPVLLHYASVMGASGIKVFGDTFDLADDLPAKLVDFCGRAANKGLDVFIETHGKQPHDTCSNTLSLLEKTAFPTNLKLIIDLYNSHITLSENLEETLSVLEPWLNHLHVKFGKTESNQYIPLPLSEAPLSYKTFLSKLCDREMWCSLEMYTDPEMLRNNMDYLSNV